MADLGKRRFHDVHAVEGLVYLISGIPMYGRRSDNACGDHSSGRACGSGAPDYSVNPGHPSYGDPDFCDYADITEITCPACAAIVHLAIKTSDPVRYDWALEQGLLPELKHG